MALLTTPAERVDVWLVRPDDIRDPHLLQRYDALMTSEERARQQKFVFEKGRHECLVTRALVRTTLSRYSDDVAPEHWQFQQNEYGRPELESGQLPWLLRFNLSHTEGLIACAVTAGVDVGVDVEWPGRMTEAVKIADRFFSPTEVKALLGCPEEARHERFFHYWTLKESYIKARGMGLSIPLDQFSFHLGDTIAISFDARLRDDPEAWQFDLLTPTDAHILAVGARTGAERRRIDLHWAVPLVR